MKQTDQEILQHAWTEARRIAREYVAAGPGRDPDATLQLIIKALVNERTNAVVDRVERRGKFEVVHDGPIPAGYADFNVPKATE